MFDHYVPPLDTARERSRSRAAASAIPFWMWCEAIGVGDVPHIGEAHDQAIDNGRGRAARPGRRYRMRTPRQHGTAEQITTAAQATLIRLARRPSP